MFFDKPIGEGIVKRITPDADLYYAANCRLRNYISHPAISSMNAKGYYH
ncbi:hypothetical protein ASZ90_013111 [hydrocarbon metagenome]|uniref:Uncharacterized protein n=1 Tax=hydrocarbon metagenome TaxID=938273 RepID=A0A0W8F8K4_9ZZZZ